ncbi:PAAR domain-containing protein [Pseudoduganella plicata]|uniref:PAAR domain-containing protein n=1 Tax=Pseudoduganella plicata TaxID=321984 RepID=A0ABX5S694_9BURK|nr:PAAR domain-containing protein [Pseudoduganella plicata]QBQ35642.1 PAAR domain-containing protein [Pseudoduganella plicata]
MARAIVRLGDKTTHGGTVVSASLTHTLRGIGIARKGDMVSCPLPGHGTNPIVEGCHVFIVDGRGVALHGHKTACGCALIASVVDATQG